MTKPEPGIAELDGAVAGLPEAERKVFERIFAVAAVEGRVNPPRSMMPWIRGQFGSAEGVLVQKIIRVTNRITLEEALFNGLRARRPMGHKPFSRDVGLSPDEIRADPFREPLTATPEDSFGRVEGKHCVTASNVAKYEGFHGVVIFNEPEPLRFEREQVVDYIDTGWRWAREAHSVDPTAKYYFFLWNSGGRAGASLPHGHAQVMLGRNSHYSRVESLRLSALSYRKRYDGDYFEDLYRAHCAVGCGFERNGIKVLAYLTPVKENEVFLMSGALDASLKDAVYEVLACFRDRMGVTCFNVGLIMPPVAEVEEDWSGFPVIARLVDRGRAESPASDIGAMELYAANVISGDPLQVARVLRGGVGEAGADQAVDGGSIE